MKTKIQYRWLMLCLVLFYACQKDTSDELTPTYVTPAISGVIPDDPERLANITLLKSSDFTLEASVSNDGRLEPGGGTSRGAKKDSDGDGILDTKDSCDLEKETVNGYLDQDGCPDEMPSTALPPPPTDTDGDGIPDTNDICPLEKETVNDFQDDDGCPDTPVIVIPPTTLPASYQLETPPVSNQGNEGSCAPFAVSYAARSIEYYYKTNATAYSASTNIFSPEYVYNQTKFGECGSGTSITSCLDLMVQQGVCTWQYMPYDDLNGCSIMPDATQISNASAYKIASYVKMMNTDHVAIKTMIASKHPVIAVVIADNSFINAREGFVWSVYSGSGTLPHALIICGYDDAKHAYKVMNSWGASWGDAGFSWIDYDLFIQKSGYNVFAIQ